MFLHVLVQQCLISVKDFHNVFLGVEIRCSSKVSCPKARPNFSDQGSNSDRSIRSPTLSFNVSGSCPKHTWSHDHSDGPGEAASGDGREPAACCGVP